MPQIFLHDIGHGHAECSREVLHCHPLLPFRILQKFVEAIRQTLRISRWVELERQFFALRHLPEVSQIGRDDRNTIGACQMRHPTAAR